VGGLFCDPLEMETISDEGQREEDTDPRETVPERGGEDEAAHDIVGDELGGGSDHAECQPGFPTEYPGGQYDWEHVERREVDLGGCQVIEETGSDHERGADQ